MKKKILYVAHLESHIFNFHIPFLKMLKENDYEVHVATNGTKKIPYCDQIFHLPFTRNPFTINNFKAYLKLRNLCKENKYDLMHCHTPIGGATGRLVCKNINTKCIYTAHGFHFYKGAPLLNWFLYYPIEKWLSRYTDILITINREDYDRAKEKFHMKQLKYVPGVGIDTKRFQLCYFNRNEYRKKLDLKENDFMILSVGELNKNKNHEIIIKAIAKLNKKNIHYFIAGKGDLRQYLISLAEELNISNQVHLLGFRKDIPELLNSSDLYTLPSIREGLNVSLMEAMASGLPCLASNIRGNVDLIKNEVNGYLCNCYKSDEFAKGILRIISDKALANSICLNNLDTIKNFDCIRINVMMKDIYKNIYKY